MSMKEQILSIAMQDPRFQETITVIEQQLSGTNIVAEDLTEAIQMLEYVLQNPEVYPEVRMAAIKDGLIDEGMFPPQFDEVLIISLLVVLYGMQDRLSQQGYARGGLAVSGKQLARMGQGGDRQLAHINDREAEVLRRMGGQGTVNPNTGLREYKGLKNVLKVALPIALSFVAPVLAPTIGAAVLGSGASALAQGVVGGAILGGGTSFLTGGDPLVGAVSGGLGGFAPGISESLAQQFPNLSESAIRAIGGGATGALGSALTGSDPVRGAAYGAIGSLAKPFVQDMTQRASTAVNNFMKNNIGMTDSGAPMSGNMKPTLSQVASSNFSSAEAAPPFESAMAGNVERVMDDRGFISGKDLVEPLLSDGQILASSELDLGTTMMNPEFQQSVVENPASGADFATEVLGQKFLKNTLADTGSDFDPYNTDAQLRNNQGMLRNLLPKGVANLLPDDLSMTELGIGALGLAALSGLSEQDQMDISMAETNGIFDKTTNQYDFVKIRGEANQRGMTLGQFLSSPFFMNDQSKYYMNNDTMYAAEGGIMDAPGYVSGPGDGRDDVINARLSDGEYVIDAESVSMLGDGSNAAGAKMLDDMRKKLRMHKGKVLAKGRFSPDAKSPLEYMRRSA